MSYHRDTLTAAQQLIVDTFNAEVRARELKAYNQALIDVSGVMVWLTTKPELTHQELGKYVMSQFDKAAENLPPNASIHGQLAFYRGLIT